MPNEQRTDHKHVRERAPFQQRVLGLAAQLFFTFPELFTITSEPILDRMPIGIYIGDERGKLYYANPPFVTMLGYENCGEFKQEVVNNGGLRSLYSDPSAREEWIKQHTSQQEPKNKGGKEIVSEQQLKRKDGSIITVRDTSVQIGTDFHGQSVYFGGIQDITEEVKLREQLERSARTDHLTGLLNRKGYEEQLEYEMMRAARQEEPLSVLMIDIDHFKDVNDTYGHPNGDLVLRGIAMVIKKNMRGIDSVARWGGEEFFITLPETDREGAFIAAEKIRDIIEHSNIPINDEVKSISNTVSIGIAQWNNDSTLRELEEMVDSALYTAKEKGRNQSMVFVEGMKRRQKGNGHNGNGHVIQ